MIITYIHRIGWFIGLVLLQVLILNSVHIAGYATPFLYIYFILKFSSGTSRNELMLWAFFFGLTIDVFSDTPGMNAAATVLLAFLRPTFLRLFVPRDTLDTLVPAIRTMGISPFLKYLVASVLVHHGMLLTLEFFSFVHIGALLLRIVTSTLLTVACIMAVEGIRKILRDCHRPMKTSAQQSQKYVQCSNTAEYNELQK